MSSDPLNNQSNPGKPSLSHSSPSTTASSSSDEKPGFIANLLSGKTPGVANIEAAYSRAGASNHHTPGHASALGSQSQEAKSGGQGVGTEQFKDNFQDQRQEPSAVGKLFNNMINGTESTK